MINSTSARILEVLRNVPSALFIKITLFERQRVCDFLRMYLTDRLSHRTTERRSRCHMPYLIPLREIKICNLK